MNTPFNLQRFLDAQQRDYAQALREIKNGLKQSHWIWYIFPKLKGFGGSGTTQYYGLDGIEEARAYYDHPVLRERLIEITQALLEHRGKSAQDIFPSVDARKVKSCMTLFWLVSENPLFKSVLDAFYEGEMDNKVAKTFGVAKNGNRNNNQINTPMRNNPFTLEQLDFMIVDRAIRYTPKGRFTEEDGGVIALYNFFGRWFSKQFIIDRINYINETSQKEGHNIPAYLDNIELTQKAFQGLHELWNKRSKAEDEEDNSQIIPIDTEMILEINNLCHFNESRKMYGLLNKYLFPDHHSGNWGIYIKTFELQHLEGIPRNMLIFHWEDDGVPHMLCLMSASDNASYDVFGFDYANTNGNDVGDHRFGEYLSIQKDINLDKILNYSGSDYKPMFRMVGDEITCCNPPLIRHKYRLKPLRIPGSNFALESCKPEYFDKYYDLYHTGNWNAKHAIERGGFNLNG